LTPIKSGTFIFQGFDLDAAPPCPSGDRREVPVWRGFSAFQAIAVLARIFAGEPGWAEPVRGSVEIVDVMFLTPAAANTCFNAGFEAC
jgi:hypothetical protein